MQSSEAFFAALAVLASALGCGLLMGIERERRKGTGPMRALAGVRSFTLVSLGGAAAALTGIAALVVVGAAMVAALGVAAYVRDRSDDPGVTTEVALLLAYLIGVTCARDQLLAAALAVVATGLLALRETLHQFSSQWLQPGEVRSGLILAALALLVYPLAPDAPLWQGVLNPRVLVRLVIVLLVIQSLAHVGRRLLQARHAMALSALASGFVSSTATIASLGMEVRAGQATARNHAGAAVLSCVATMVQIIVVAATVQPLWLGRLALPALAGGGVAVAWGWWSARSALRSPAGLAAAEATWVPSSDTPMFKLRDALVIAALLTGIQVAVQLLTVWLGDAGMLAGALLSALADVHAATAAVLVRGGPGSASGAAIATALMAALLVHAGSKCAVALASGGWRYALAVAPGIVAHTLAFVGVMALQP
ncbi:MAG TPA: hypothetical protein DCM06_04485 [Comamonadaceae bacterium]|nr:hypothetical protein [Comamonadaceae bacterium]